MKARDFFSLVIKLFGLYSLSLSVFQFIPNALTTSSYEYENFQYLMFLVVSLTVALVLTYFLIWKSGAIVDLLKISEGFENEQIFFKDLNEAAIIKVSLIVAGALLFFSSFPDLIGNTLMILKVDNVSVFVPEKKNSFWVVSFIKVFFSLLMILYYKPIQQFLLKNEE